MGGFLLLMYWQGEPGSVIDGPFRYIAIGAHQPGAKTTEDL
jgi:hypothetical protein